MSPVHALYRDEEGEDSKVRVADDNVDYFINGSGPRRSNKGNVVSRNVVFEFIWKQTSLFISCLERK